LVAATFVKPCCPRISFGTKYTIFAITHCLIIVIFNFTTNE